MKSGLKLIPILLVGTALFYAACKKDGSLASTPPSQTSSDQIASAQIATGLYQSLSGAYGGVNLADGINAPSFANSVSSKTLNSLSGCGFFADTLNFKTNIGDSIKSTSTGLIDFHFLCGSGGVRFGFTNVDSLLTTGKAPHYTFTYDLVQVYHVTGSNNNPNQLTVDSGKIKGTNITVATDKKGVSSNITNRFDLDNLVINLNTFDITNGDVTFTSTGTYGTTSWHLTGTINFQGNHIAIVTVNGVKYKVNLLTGVITQV